MSAEKLVVIGQGYVGLPLAMRAVEAGLDVVGLDVDADRVKRLASGESFIEDIPTDRLGRALSSGRYHPSTEYTDAEGFDICVITVPTPLRDGTPDLSFVEQAGVGIGPYVRPGCTVILESTTYPGTTEELLRPLLESASGLTSPGDFHLGYSPERIDPGNPDLAAGEHAEGRLRCGRGVTGPGGRVLPAPRAPHRAGGLHPRGRADQADREHLPPGQHRADQRADHALAPPRHRRLAGHRRRGDQAVRLHAVPARPRRRRALPADRPVLPVLAGQAPPRPAVPVHRAGQRHQPRDARARRAADHGGAEPERPGRQRRTTAAARSGVQEEHRRHAGLPRGRRGPPPAGPRRRGPRGGAVRRAAPDPGRGHSGRAHASGR